MRKVYYPVACTREVIPDSGKVVAIGDTGTRCTLFLHEGRWHAVGELCPHQNTSLEGACVEDGLIVCKRHGFRFDLDSGECATLGGYGLPVFDVRIEGEVVLVGVWDYE